MYYICIHYKFFLKLFVQLYKIENVIFFNKIQFSNLFVNHKKIIMYGLSIISDFV